MPTTSANTLTAFDEEFWTPTMQDTFFKENVAIALADVDFREILYEGVTVHKPYGSYPRVQTYVKGTDIVVKDIGATDDSISVDTTKIASFYVDDIDKIQNKYDAIKEFSTFAQRQLNNAIDQSVISEYSNAGSALDEGDIGGTSGDGIVESTSNISNIFTVSQRALLNKKMRSPEKFALIGPRTLETIQLSLSQRETSFGDKVGVNGKVGDRFGFELYVSNNLPYSASLVTSANIVDTDTITINGVVFTADANGVADGAGHFSIGANNDAAVANLILAINGTGTPGVSTYIALSAEDRQSIEEAGIVAVDGGSADSIDITGFGDIVVSEEITDGIDVWGSQTQYLLMGIKKAIALIIQKKPSIEFRPAQLRLGRYVHPWTMYGKGTWERNKNALVSVQLDTSSWV